MALGFTMPLLIILGAETLVGGLLLCPAPINKPAIQLVRASYTQVRRVGPRRTAPRQRAAPARLACGADAHTAAGTASRGQGEPH